MLVSVIVGYLQYVTGRFIISCLDSDLCDCSVGCVCWPWQAAATQIKTISEVREQHGPALYESSHRPRGPSFDFPTWYEANSLVSSQGLVILVLLVPMKTSAM